MSQRYIGGLIYNPPGGFSGYFDGSGDYLTVADNTALQMSGDFTWEAWVFPISNPSGGNYKTLWAQRANSGGFGGPAVVFDSAGNYLLFISNAAASTWSVSGFSTGLTTTLNSWQHIALVKSGTTVTLYKNGVSGTSTTHSTAVGTSGSLSIMAGAADGIQAVDGYMSNFRILKGTALYTSAFTPPVGPLQAITNTSLLTCAYPTFRDGSSNNFTITVNGNTAVSTQNPFPLTQLPNPALGNQGNGVYSMSQYQALRSQNLWPAIDQYWPYVTLMLHGNGTNGAQNNTFLDSSTNNFTITRNGNTTQGTFTPYGSNWSNYFDGTGDYLTAGSSVSLSGDFTVECWVYGIAYGANNAFYIYGLGNDLNNTGATFYINNNGYLRIFTGNAVKFSGTSGAITLNTWNHVAFVRSSGTVKAYLNGVEVDSSSSWTNTISGLSHINAELNGASPTTYAGGTCYISNFRVVTSAVYTSNFTPPTAPLTAITNTSLLTCQSNRFIDNSSNNFAITRNGDVSVQRFSPFAPTTPYAAGTIGGSGYFDGSGDYLSVAASANQDFGSSAFTVEFWWYPNADSRQWFYHASTDYWFGIDYKSSGSTMGLWASSNGSSWDLINADPGGNGISTGTPRMNSWNHVAVGRSSGTWSMWLNGTRVLNLTGITSAIVSRSAQAKIIGGWAAGSQYLVNGYMNDFRVVIGTDVYGVSNSTITVPTAPLAAITNTQLLTNFTNGGIIDNAMMNDLETVGNAQISTSVSKFGGGSLAFDGSGDYLLPSSAGTNNPLALGSGDFTLEFWLNFAALGDVTVIDWRPTSTNGAYPTLYMDVGTNKIIYYANSANRITSSTVFTTGTWYHIAVVRSSGATKLYINGNNEGSTYSDSTNYLAAAVRPVIGANGAGNGTNAINGYLDDLRITKGYARYTANFTPQRSQWQDQ